MCCSAFQALWVMSYLTPHTFAQTTVYEVIEIAPSRRQCRTFSALSFFPVDYQTHKRFYRPGARLNVGLALLAMRLEEGEKAASLREKLGIEQEYDEEGRPAPLHFGMERGLSARGPQAVNKRAAASVGRYKSIRM